MSHGGSENSIFLIKPKCLKNIMAGREASIASTIGALKSGSPSASRDLAKQKEVMVSTAKHRIPR